MRKFLAISLAAALCATPSFAQITSSDNEAAKVKWNTFNTQNYKLIYPRGTDSLAREYAKSLENFYASEAISSGMLPNQNYRKRMPVILHPFNSISNGMVAWTPRRMELYTIPEPYSTLPQEWITQLTVHESRHSSQMQLGRHKTFAPFHYVTGELFAGSVAGLYPGPHFLEGDAVVAETALTNSGRGRNADFLEFWRAEQADSIRRNFWQWRYSSLRRYTPDYYRAGYVLIAGMRTVYDNPDFTADYFDRIFAKKSWPFPVKVLQKTVRQTSGKKFNAAFSEILDTLDAQWARNDAARNAITESMDLQPVTKEPRQWADIHGSVCLEGRIYAVRTSMSKTPELVQISPDGRIKQLCLLNWSTDKIAASEPLSRLYWTEIKSDKRYGMHSYSEIRYMPSPGKVKTLRHKTRWFNPTPSPSDSTLLVTEYAVDGSAAIIRVNGINGDEIERFPAPDGLQPLETAFAGGKILASATCTEGTGIYSVSDEWVPVLPACATQIKSLFCSADGNEVLFTSDRTGVKELYSLSMDGSVRQMTTTHLGAQDFAFIGDTLYCSAISAKQRGLYKIAANQLLNTTVDYSQLCRWEMAERLSAQEQALGYNPDSISNVEMTQAKSYSKLGHLVKIHSWAPMYIDYDAVESLSMETVSSGMSLGATAFLQNELSTLSGTAGVKLWDDTYGWRPSVGVDLSYTGWYPVIELKMSCNERNSLLYQPTIYTKDNSSGIGLRSQNTSSPSVYASLKTYIPFNLSSGAWSRGIIPQLSYTLTSDKMRYQYVGMSWDEANEKYVEDGKNSGKTTPDSRSMDRLSLSLRGYTMLSTARNGIYPRLGLGIETGFSSRVKVTQRFSPICYLYSYGYLPGLFPNHGIRVSWAHEKQVYDYMAEYIGNSQWKIPFFQEGYLDIVPRGFSVIEGANSSIAYGYPSKDKFTVDYAFPFLPLDWSGLCPLAYVRNLEACLHYDFSLLHGSERTHSLMSTGLDLKVHLGNLAFLPYSTRVGVSYNYNYGGESLFKDFQKHYVSMIFAVDL